MRNQSLLGYLLHQRPYQEKRALYYLFSQQFGVIHGIGKKGAPLFEPLQLFATGKRDLKTFSQITLYQPEDASLDASQEDQIEQDDNGTDTTAPDLNFTKHEPKNYQQISGQQQYAALYLNELLLKLLPIEDPMPLLWQYYQQSLLALKQPLSADELRLCLRQFEQYLFQELGFSLNLTQDNLQIAIEPNTLYRFLPEVGLMPMIQTAEHDDNIRSDANSNAYGNASAQALFSGNEVLAMEQAGITLSTLHSWARLHRHLIDHLLDYQPLQSRLLWQQQQRYQ